MTIDRCPANLSRAVMWAANIEGIAMTTFPITEHALLVRTDFTNHAAWDAVCSAVSRPGADLMEAFEFMRGFEVPGTTFSDEALGSISVVPLEGPQFADLTAAELLQCVPGDYPHAYLFVFDSQSASDEEQTVLVVDLYKKPGQTFRTVPTEVWSIDANLSICNMDWEDYADAADQDGVFRGFE